MKRILAFVVVGLFSSQVFAGLYLEPYVGMEMGTSKGTVIAPVAGTITEDEKLSGVNFGAKVGLSLAMISYGIDYMTGSLTGKDQSTPAAADTKNDVTDMGLYARVGLPFVSFSATYFLSSKLENSQAELEGGGYKVGVGFKFFPFISINVDMIAINYDEGKNSAGTFTSADVDRKSFMLGLSFPIDI
jgi:hypothetical protein